mmetsp:Transcript_14898/g.38041  ORF Transcript_14898/g.38041 Transcript_14898/m.38041 type:complete len:219 (-) Transcript_14898:2597-3253(-)
MLPFEGSPGCASHPNIRSILFSATTKGVLLSLRSSMLSSVCGSSPCTISTTKIATSHRDEPRDRKFVKLSCPGVSITSSDGILYSISGSLSLSASFLTASIGKNVAPICCVMPPASASCTLVRRILSRILVLPVSTCPRMAMMGARRLSRERAAMAVLILSRRRLMTSARRNAMSLRCRARVSSSEASESSESLSESDSDSSELDSDSLAAAFAAFRA